MNTYSGESIAKKIARIRLYLRSHQALKFFDPEVEKSFVMFLIGPDASEVGAIKHILGVPADHVVGVDMDKEACRALEKKWPGAHVVHGDLRKEKTFELVLDETGYEMFDFIHLDLMGPLSKKSEIIYRMWSQMCQMNGVLAVTYLRARESCKGKLQIIRTLAKLLADKYKLARGGEPKKLYKILSADPERALSHLAALGSVGNDFGAIDFTTLGKKLSGLDVDEARYFCTDQIRPMIEGMFTALSTYSYRSDNSPMGVLATQYVTPQTVDSDSYAILRYAPGRHTSSVIRKDAMLDLLADVDSLCKNYTREQVCEILDVSPGTLAAWKAHRTMNTYKK